MNQWVMFLMTRMFKRITYIFAALALAACSGTIDPEAQKPDVPAVNPMEEVPEGVLRIFADKTEVSADGNDMVTFTIMFGKEDVSSAQTLVLIREYDGETKRTKASNKFSTVTAGTYKFTAEYYYGGKNYTDNSVTIEAKPYFSGEEKEYRQRVLAVYFTSTGCTSCPSATKGLKAVQDANPGMVSAVAFHSHMGAVADPMTIPETTLFNAVLGGFDGLPRLFWNMRQGTHLIGPSFTESYAEEVASYEPQCGVSVTSSWIPNDYDGKPEGEGCPCQINIGITSNIPAVYRYLVFIVEDGIVAEQTGDPNYVHNNVVRAVLTSEKGDKINDNLPLTVGVEAKAEKTFDTASTWNINNLRVIVAATTSTDGGYTFVVNNVAECKLGESVDYQYAE